MPGVEGIVFRKTTRIARPLPDQAASLLRLHYHDCFVQACDVSMLLDSTDGSPAEKDAMPNQSPRGMDVVARVKDKLEKSKGLSWLVALGRRDGRTSRAGNCGRLPLLYGNITVMIKVFAAKGLDVKDLVMPSAAHTFGKEHCSSFADLLELYYGSICSTDTTLDERFLKYSNSDKTHCSGGNDLESSSDHKLQTHQLTFEELEEAIGDFGDQQPLRHHVQS
ncbi:Peroxidase 1 [Hordeum vulgare]|nr:Peroxidase 1 [Hordeum vulgare]